MRNLMPLSALLLTGFAHADRIDDLVRAEMKARGVPGLTIAILRDGRPIKIKGYGFANLEHKVPAKAETIYQSGSVGKQFAATLTMILVRDGKLSLDDEISKWFPESGDAWRGVKVRHLLSHTSGLADMPYGTMDLRKAYGEDDLVKMMTSQKPVEGPGTKWRYNNGGYVLLGALIRRATGRPYWEVMEERIFRPLGMTTARLISEREIVPNRAAGYEMTSKGIKNQEWVAPELNTTADGALYLSALDYAKWDAALRTDRLLPQADLMQMWSPFSLADGKAATYGFGWAVPAFPGHKFVEHGGAWQGFSTYIGREMDKGITVVVLSNLDAGHSGVQTIGRRLLGLYAPYLAPKKAASAS
jgi:CubicO group peptidase (beta-lactamase class C family)